MEKKHHEVAGFGQQGDAQAGGGSLFQRIRSKLSSTEGPEQEQGTKRPQLKGKAPLTPNESKNGSSNAVNSRNGSTPRGTADKNLARKTRDNQQKKAAFSCCGKKHGNYLTVLYFSIKMLYLVNIFGQLFLMERFVGSKQSFYGIRMMIDLLNGTTWQRSGNFPRVTFCDFDAKKIGANERQVMKSSCLILLLFLMDRVRMLQANNKRNAS
ncbi:hypothetical protein Ciccas_009974 [Cichlidogyrus casuarinus]|uniref:Innexin n=1 Tax=Cichlidogyrus casuarinus TaxID=1844966 RepID=A0ABD2PVH1_9PLAT